MHLFFVFLQCKHCTACGPRVISDRSLSYLHRVTSQGERGHPPRGFSVRPGVPDATDRSHLAKFLQSQPNERCLRGTSTTHIHPASAAPNSLVHCPHTHPDSVHEHVHVGCAVLICPFEVKDVQVVALCGWVWRWFDRGRVIADEERDKGWTRGVNPILSQVGFARANLREGDSAVS